MMVSEIIVRITCPWCATDDCILVKAASEGASKDFVVCETCGFTFIVQAVIDVEVSRVH